MSRTSGIGNRKVRTLIFVFVLAYVLAFVGALPTVFGQSRQLSLADILIALRSKKAELDEKNKILTDAVKDRGITFALTPEIEKELDNTGAKQELINAIRTKATPPPTLAKLETPKTETPAPKPTPTPLDFSFYRNSASAHMTKGELDLAITDLGKAIELKPADAGTYLDRALVYLKQDKTDSAVADLNKTIEIDPKNAAAFFTRAQVSEKLGKPDNAIADYDRAAELDAGNDQAKAAASRLRDAKAQAAKKAEPAPPQPEKPSGPQTFSTGALNNYAVSLAIPNYSETNRKMGIQGRVTVQVVLDEEGKVVSAQATDGPKGLRLAAEDAVKRSKFRPVRVGTSDVRASGFIVFNFVANQ